MHRRSSLWALAVLMLVPFAVLAEDSLENDWPGWSGPNGARSGPDGGVFDGPAFGLNEHWGLDIGPGYSSLAVVDGVAITGYSDGKRDLLGAFGAGGKKIWTYDLGETYKGHDGSDDGPLATPTVSGGAVYFLGAHGRLAAVDLESGREMWKRELMEELGAREPDYGFTSSPLVVGDVVIVQGGGDGGRSLLGFDAKSGKKRWALADDRIGYQSPAVVTLGGREQVVAVTNRQMMGVDPASGDLIWSHDLADDDEDEGFAHPLPVGDNGVLLTSWSGGTLYNILSTDGLYAVEEAWNEPTLRGYAIPVYRDGYLYGYNGNFLTCVDAASGKAVWKSRPPGAGMLIGAGDHLVIQTEEGEVVIVEASPEGYVEKTRFAAFEPGYPTAPSFAGGKIYARSPVRIASLSVATLVDPVTTEAAVTAPAEGEFGRWVESLGAKPDKQKAIETYLAEQSSFPVLEGERWAHFVYQGEVEDLALTGNFHRGGEQLIMANVEGTDFYYRSVEIEPNSIYTYGFQEYDRFFVDPQNSERTGDGPRAQSLLTTEGFEERPFLEAPNGKRGAIEEVEWNSELLENERSVSVYLPVGYARSNDRYPLLVVQLGDQALTAGKMANALDHLIGEKMAPVVAAFVPRREWAEYAGSRPDVYSDALAKELVPYLEDNFRVESDAARRGTMGVGSGGFVSLFASFHTDLFGRVAAQSFYRGDLGDELMEKIRGSSGPAKTVYVHWSLRDYLDEGSDLDAKRDSEQVAALLEEKGHRTVTREVGHGPGWEGWSASYDELLSTLYPLE